MGQTALALTSIDESIDIFNLSYGRVITVGYQGLNSVQQAVNIDDGSVVLNPLLQLLQPLLPVFVLGDIFIASFAHFPSAQLGVVTGPLRVSLIITDWKV